MSSLYTNSMFVFVKIWMWSMLPIPILVVPFGTYAIHNQARHLLLNILITNNTSFSTTTESCSSVSHPYTSYGHIFTLLAVFNSSRCPSSQDQHPATLQPTPIVHEVLLTHYSHNQLHPSMFTNRPIYTKLHNNQPYTMLTYTCQGHINFGTTILHTSAKSKPQESLYITRTQENATNQINYHIHYYYYYHNLPLTHTVHFAEHIEAPFFSPSLILPCK